MIYNLPESTCKNIQIRCMCVLLQTTSLKYIELIEKQCSLFIYKLLLQEVKKLLII